MTCNNQPTCYHHARRGPAIFCELFDNYVPPHRRVIEELIPAAPVAAMASGTEEVDGGVYKGLCMNCDHRTTCGDRKTSAGVWHCENDE